MIAMKCSLLTSPVSKLNRTNVVFTFGQETFAELKITSSKESGREFGNCSGRIYKKLLSVNYWILTIDGTSGVESPHHFMRIQWGEQETCLTN